MRDCAGILEFSGLHRCQHPIHAAEPGKLALAAMEQKARGRPVHAVPSRNIRAASRVVPLFQHHDSAISLTHFTVRLRKRPEWFRHKTNQELSGVRWKLPIQSAGDIKDKRLFFGTFAYNLNDQTPVIRPF
jgi:hypothetical protein